MTDKPKLNAEYSKSFNFVDKFNRHLSNIKYRPRIADEQMRLLIGIIEVIVVQTFVIYNDLKSIRVSDEEEAVSIQQFACNLAIKIHETIKNSE